MDYCRNAILTTHIDSTVAIGKNRVPHKRKFYV